MVSPCRAHDRAHLRREGAGEERDAVGLYHQLAIGIAEAAGEIQYLVDHRAHRGLGDDDAHLVGKREQLAADDLARDRVCAGLDLGRRHTVTWPCPGFLPARDCSRGTGAVQADGRTRRAGLHLRARDLSGPSIFARGTFQARPSLRAGPFRPVHLCARDLSGPSIFARGTFQARATHPAPWSGARGGPFRPARAHPAPWSGARARRWGLQWRVVNRRKGATRGQPETDQGQAAATPARAPGRRRPPARPHRRPTRSATASPPPATCCWRTRARMPSSACNRTCSPTSTLETRCRRCWRGASSWCSGASTAPPGSRPSSSSTASSSRSATGCARRGRGAPSAPRSSACARTRSGEDSDADALSKAMDERDRAMEERRRAILAVDVEILLGAPSAQILVEREESARAFDRLARHEATLQRSLNRTLAEFRSLKREAAAQSGRGVSGGPGRASRTGRRGALGRTPGRALPSRGPGGRKRISAKPSQSSASR